MRITEFVPVGPASKKVMCPVCGRSGIGFPRPRPGTAPLWQRSCLRGHPFGCACGKTFSSESGINSHIRFTQTGEHHRVSA